MNPCHIFLSKENNIDRIEQIDITGKKIIEVGVDNKKVKEIDFAEDCLKNFFKQHFNAQTKILEKLFTTREVYKKFIDEYRKICETEYMNSNIWLLLSQKLLEQNICLAFDKDEIKNNTIALIKKLNEYYKYKETKKEEKKFKDYLKEKKKKHTKLYISVIKEIAEMEDLKELNEFKEKTGYVDYTTYGIVEELKYDSKDDAEEKLDGKQVFLRRKKN